LSSPRSSVGPTILSNQLTLDAPPDAPPNSTQRPSVANGVANGVAHGVANGSAEIPLRPSHANATPGRGLPIGADDNAGAQIRFRRALTAGYALWAAFAFIDWMVTRYLDAGRLWYMLAIRAAVVLAALPILRRLYKSPPPSLRTLAILDTCSYGLAAAGIGLMCVEFRGLASPYADGFCLVLLLRTVTAQEPLRRGLYMHGIPVALYYGVLLGSALFSPAVAAQLHNPAALATLLLNSAFILGTYVCLVLGGHIVWALRKQLFEARSLGRYRLKRRLASGGMGDVWVAYHPGLKRDVAVKVLRADAQERSEGAVSRFEREVCATAELMHPNTIRVFDYGTTEDGLCYYVMELLDGETLRSHVDRLGPLPPARAIHIVGQAARALGEAHQRGIVHRDIKPENLFLTSLGGEHDFVKVIDFGIAKVAGTDGTMTRTGWVLGTPEYMSPEVAMGKQADSRSDVYALGAVLYFLLCGRPPFVGENAGRLFFAHATETPLRPSVHVGVQLPADLEAVVMRALEKEPLSRYASASDLALALAACRLAGKWTFGDATIVARQSSRPPPAQIAEKAVPPPPRLPSIRVETRDEDDDTTGRLPARAH
jgi:serine/threonine-protein kinase